MITVLLLITGFFAGIMGALLGLGGGVIIVPVLTIFFHLPIQTAIGVSLVGVIATSSGAAGTYIRNGATNIRLGLILELATTVGAIAGAFAAGFLGSKTLYLLFAGLMLYTTFSMYRKTAEEPAKPSQNLGEVAAGSAFLKADSQYSYGSYKVRNLPGGLFFSSLAGMMSGLLGIGGGVIKVPVMYLLMGVPIKAATATSNFMVGITACASALVYFYRGHIDVLAAVSMALGVLAGAAAGTRIHEQVSTRMLNRIFIIIFLGVAVQMAIKGLGM